MVDGLRSQPVLLESFKKALGLESKKNGFHAKTYSRLEKFSGDDNQWQEWVFNLIMITNNVIVKRGEARARISLK